MNNFFMNDCDDSPLPEKSGTFLCPFRNIRADKFDKKLLSLMENNVYIAHSIMTLC